MLEIIMDNMKSVEGVKTQGIEPDQVQNLGI